MCLLSHFPSTTHLCSLASFPPFFPAIATTQEFDHTCPWTGTAIGRDNMRAFTAFVSSCGALVVYVLFVLFVMLVFYHS